MNAPNYAVRTLFARIRQNACDNVGNHQTTQFCLQRLFSTHDHTFGNTTKPILKTLAQSGLNRVHFLVAVPAGDLVSWSASADVGICTIVGNSDSYRHSMPNKLFEYAMAGLPDITSNYEGMGSFVIENDFGITCDPISVPELAAAIKTLQGNPEQRTRLANNAKVASSKFNQQVEQEKLLAVYAHLVD